MGAASQHTIDPQFRKISEDFEFEDQFSQRKGNNLSHKLSKELRKEFMHDFFRVLKIQFAEAE